MKSKGFTLIELLAVIVILAIIALIATPIVLNIIKDSKESANLQSAQFYLDAVEHSITKKMMDDPTFEPSNCDIQADGNLKCDRIDVKVEVSGEKPSSGTIKLENGKTEDVELILNEKTITKNNEGKLVYKGNESNIAFDQEITFTHLGDTVYSLDKCFDESKVKDKSKYKLTINDVNNNDKIYEAFSSFGDTLDVNNGSFSEGFLLVDKKDFLYVHISNSNFCYFNTYGETLNLEGKHHVKLEYVGDEDYLHVLRVFDYKMEIFSLELVAGDATLEIKDSDGGVTNLNVVVEDDGSFSRIEVVDYNYYELLYQLLQEGKTLNVTIKQGNNTYELGGTKFNHRDKNEYDCMSSDYYYWGNNKLGYLFGC